jgi:hypothetical protein
VLLLTSAGHTAAELAKVKIMASKAKLFQFINFELHFPLVQSTRLKNEALQMVEFEGLFNLYNIESILSKSFIVLILNTLEQ